MAAPYSTLRSKLNRAVCAYLVSAHAGGVDDVIPAFSQSLSTYPNTTVRATRGIPDPVYTGNYRIQLQISVKGSATQATGEPNLALARVQFDQRVATTQDALMGTYDASPNFVDLQAMATLITAAGRALATVQDPTDPAQVQLAANNADMVDFTIMQWVNQGFGDGKADAEGCSWEEILLFEALCCSSNVD